jgi:cAMP-dependent protein kinase regulator
MTVIIWSLQRKFLRNFLQQLENNFKLQQMNFLKTVKMFEKLNENMLRQIANVLQIVTYEQTHEKIIRQGEIGEKFYLLVHGRVSVTKNSSSSSFSSSTSLSSSLSSSSSSSSLKNEITQLSPGQYFGELALISNEPRKANVIVLEAPVMCYTIDQHNFTSVMGTLQNLENENFGIEILKKVKLLESLSEKQLQILGRCLERMEFSEGMVILSQGEEEGDRFYIIVSGEVMVSVNHIEVARLKSGSYFGEMALMNNERRNATITAVDEVICLTLNRAQVPPLP